MKILNEYQNSNYIGNSPQKLENKIIKNRKKSLNSEQ